MSECFSRPSVSILTEFKLKSNNNLLLYSLPQIYEEFYHTINNADHEKDLRWWSNNHGVNMAMNWPLFEVCRVEKIFLIVFHLIFLTVGVV